MKKTCATCKAEEDYGCSLGYKTKKLWMEYPCGGIRDHNKPLEQCPKPLTNRKYIDMALDKIPGKAGTL